MLWKGFIWGVMGTHKKRNLGKLFKGMTPGVDLEEKMGREAPGKRSRWIFRQKILKVQGHKGVRWKGIMGTAGGSVTWKPKVKCKTMPHHRGLGMTYQGFLNIPRWQLGPLEHCQQCPFAMMTRMRIDCRGGLLERDTSWGIWPLSR